MTADKTPCPVHFASDDELGYSRARTLFMPGGGLMLDEPYRLAHLPLVNPSHPDVIAHEHGRNYTMGRHPRVHSLILPVPQAALEASEAFQSLEVELRQAPFATKIAWDVVARRKGRLHATVCGSLASGEDAPVLPENAVFKLAQLPRFKVQLRGVFSGNVNVGRLYLKAYPEKREGMNVLQYIQALLGRNITDLYVVGLYNFTDHLDACESQSLSELMTGWWDKPLLTFEVTLLEILSSLDDLVLDSKVEQRIPLGA